MNKKRKGFLLTLLLSGLLLVAFFGSVLKHPNRVCFASSGDGFKSYYAALYHARYDSTYLHFEGMNYPWGESVFFTDNLVPITNSVKWFSQNIVDVRSQLVGIINLSMLLSLVLTALFLYLVLTELGVGWLFAVFAAIGISFLSPQVDRLGGHFTLAYAFWLPLMLWLLLRQYRQMSFKGSALIAGVVFLSSAMHFYFFGFWGLLLTVFCLFLVVQNWSDRRAVFRLVTHYFIQFLLPFIVLQTLVSMSDMVSDRTTHPYGFLIYTAHPVSVFLPHGAPYSFVPRYLTVFSHLDWESWAFIGVVALVGSCTGLVFATRQLFAKQPVRLLDQQPVLQIFLVAALLALLLSFGFPFKLGLEGLVDYIGPFKQLRALARFSWLFYYVVNVLTFFYLYRWIQKMSKPGLKYVVGLVAFALLFVDAYFNVRAVPAALNNELLPESYSPVAASDNDALKSVDFSEFQAIVPVPYFHIGSENIGVLKDVELVKQCFLLSLQTGLPTAAVMMGRTSISQTYTGFQLFIDPIQPFKLIGDLPNTKDFLLMQSKTYSQDVNEARILQKAQLLAETDQFRLLRLAIDSLRAIPAEYQSEQLASFRPDRLTERDGVLLSDTSNFFHHRNIPLGIWAQDWCRLVDTKIGGSKAGETYLLSFWLRHGQRDAFARFNLELVQKNEAGETSDYQYTDIGPWLKALDGDNAFFEIPVGLKSDDAWVQLSVRNTALYDVLFVLDDVAFRRADQQVFQSSDSILKVNFRPIPRP